MDAEEIKLLTENVGRLVKQAAKAESEKVARANLMGAIQSLTKCVELITAELTKAK
jgi:histone H3/H4